MKSSHFNYRCLHLHKGITQYLSRYEYLWINTLGYGSMHTYVYTYFSSDTSYSLFEVYAAINKCLFLCKYMFIQIASKSLLLHYCSRRIHTHRRGRNWQLLLIFIACRSFASGFAVAVGVVGVPAVFLIVARMKLVDTKLFKAAFATIYDCSKEVKSVTQWNKDVKLNSHRQLHNNASKFLKKLLRLTTWFPANAYQVIIGFISHVWNVDVFTCQQPLRLGVRVFMY